jgi:SOS-response transcriptional repressor LexA
VTSVAPDEDTKARAEKHRSAKGTGEGEPFDQAKIALTGFKAELAQLHRLGIVPAQYAPGTNSSAALLALQESLRKSSSTKAEKELLVAQQIVAGNTDPVEALKKSDEQFKLALKEADSYYLANKPQYMKEQAQFAADLVAAQQNNEAAFGDFEVALANVPDTQALKIFHLVQAFVVMKPADPDIQATGAILERNGLLEISQKLAGTNASIYQVHERIADLKVRASQAQLDRVRTREAYIEVLKRAGEIARAMRYMSEMPEIWADSIFKDMPPNLHEPKANAMKKA